MIAPVTLTRDGLWEKEYFSFTQDENQILKINIVSLNIFERMLRQICCFFFKETVLTKNTWKQIQTQQESYPQYFQAIESIAQKRGFISNTEETHSGSEVSELNSPEPTTLSKITEKHDERYKQSQNKLINDIDDLLHSINEKKESLLSQEEISQSTKNNYEIILSHFHIVIIQKECENELTKYREKITNCFAGEIDSSITETEINESIEKNKANLEEMLECQDQNFQGLKDKEESLNEADLGALDFLRDKIKEIMTLILENHERDLYELLDYKNSVRTLQRNSE